MAAQVLTNSHVLVATFDASGFTGALRTDPAAVSLVDVTTFASGGYQVQIPAVKNYGLKIDGFCDFAAAGFSTAFPGTVIGTQQLAAISPVSGGATAGDWAVFFRGIVDSYTPLMGTPTDAAGFSVSLTSDAAEIIGQVAAPLALRSTTLTGTALTLTGPTATQKVYAGLIVTATTGTNLVVKVQSAPLANFASPTDRITFSTMSATGWQYQSLDGAVTDGFWRVTATIGSGSFTYAAFVGVL